MTIRDCGRRAQKVGSFGEVDRPSFPGVWEPACPSSFLLPNHGEPVDGGFLLANDFSQDSDNWVQIAPYGDYPHSGPLGPDNKPLRKNGKLAFPQGVIQRIDNGAGKILVDNFKSHASRLGRNFPGLPWYIGHHDLDPIKYPDPKSYGWIRNLANREDGVYGKVDWTPGGKDLVEKKEFKLFSPFFSRGEDTQMLAAGGRGIVRPTFLKSVGFTNNPNMDVMPLANDRQSGALITRDSSTAEGRIAATQAAIREEMALANIEYDEAFLRVTKGKNNSAVTRALPNTFQRRCADTLEAVRREMILANIGYDDAFRIVYRRQSK